MSTSKTPPPNHGAARYESLDEIARGGVGIVWRAHDVSLGREVALKVLRDEHMRSDDVRARFIEEAQIGGQLQHPGVVPVYELGTDENGKPFFAMKLVRGETLAAELAKRKDPSDERARFLQVFEQVCQTMAFAHERDVVHRDLKPANVMIGRFGEVQVVDWGFAKVLSAASEAAKRPKIDKRSQTARPIRTMRSSGDDSSTHSRAGTVFGTPAYMPPEQARGEVEDLDGRSDVFALGAILCEILSGTPPYRAKDGDLLLQAARHDLRAARERLSSCSAEPALVELCLRCLRADPDHRPASAQVLATEIGAYRAALETRAQRAEIDAVAARWRFRATLGIGTALVAGLVVAGAIWFARERDAEARRTEAQNRVANALAAAERVTGEARAAQGERAAAWDRAQTAVEAAQRSALSGEVEPELRRSVDALASSIAVERDAAHDEARRVAREQTLFARVAELRVPLEHEVASSDSPRGAAARLGESYSIAFAEFLEGRSPSSLGAGEIASLRSRRIATQLAWAFDDWALAVVEERPLEAETLQLLAREIDPEHPWRARLRALLHEPRTAAGDLELVASEAIVAEQEPLGLQMLARALLRAGEHEEATRLLQRSSPAHPADPGLAFELGLALEMARPKPWSEIAGHYQQARALAPENFRISHRLGIALRAAGRKREALQVFAWLCEREPENAHWFTHLGQLQMESSEVAAGVATLKAAIEQDPTDVVSPYNLGAAFYDLGRYAEAAPWFEEAIRRDPEFPAGHTNLGNARVALARYAEAIAPLERALALDDRDFEALVGLTTAHNALRQPKEAEPHILRALELQPRSALAHLNLGVTLVGLERADEAMAEFRRALEVDPSSVRALEYLTIELQDQERSTEVLALFENHAARNPSSANAQLRLGLAFGDLDLDVEAITCFERGLVLDPDETACRINLGYRRAHLGEHAVALDHFERARDFLDKHPSAFAEEWIPILDREIARVQRALANAELLQSIASGEAETAEFEDQQEALAHLRGRGRHREAVQLWERIAAQRKLPELRWRHVRIADAAKLAASDADPEARREGRTLLLRLLREELATELAGAERVADDRARARLRYLLERPALAPFRDEDRLVELPAGEAAEWSAFWRDLRRAMREP